MFQFQFMQINNSLTYERFKNRNDYITAYNAFNLFINDEIFDLIIKHINENVELHRFIDKFNSQT